MSAPWAALSTEVRRFVVPRVAPADVDDVVQEVLSALASGPDARSPIALATTIARRTVADHHRRRAREHARLARLALEPETDAEEPVTRAESALARALAGFLDEITPLYADALRAVDVQGLAQADVARAMGVPRSTLRTRVQRGRAELRERVRRCCAIELDRRGRVIACAPRQASDGCGCD